MQNNREGQVKLSVRQMQVLKLVCTEALQYKEIAHRLKISPNTVAGHIQQMLDAIGLGSKHLLMLWGWQHPEALRGEWADRRLHKPGCSCHGPVCVGEENAA